MKVSHNAPSNAQALEISKAAEKAKAASAGTNTASATKSTNGASRGGSQVEISDDAVLMNRAREAAMAQPDIRADKVADIKKQVQSGKYKIDAAAIADKLVEEHLYGDHGKNHL